MRPWMKTAGRAAAAMFVGAAAWACNSVLGIEDAALCSACGTDAHMSTPAQALSTLSPVRPVLDAGAQAAGEVDAGVRGQGQARDAGPSCLAPAAEVASVCASCGGVVACDGTCSVRASSTMGQPCGSCGGTIDCNGNCTIATPSDYGSALLRDTTDSFACCFINEVRSYGPDGRDSTGCYPGYVYAGCTVSVSSGRGAVSLVSEDAASCTCQVAVQNTGLEGAAYEVHLRLTRACN